MSETAREKVFLARIRPDLSLDFGSPFNHGRFRDFQKDNIGKEIAISRHVRKRSLQQDKFYWLYLEHIEFETGDNANDLHEYFKRTLLAPKFITVRGKTIKVPRSTTELNKVEFGDYIEKICALTEIEIPDAEAFKKWRDSAPAVGEQYKKNGSQKTTT